MKLKFGKDIRNLSNNKRCIDCNEEFALIQREELCQSCSKVCMYILYQLSILYIIYQPLIIAIILFLQYMCKDCGGISKAFIPRNMKMGITCRSCNREYRKENKKCKLFH